MMKSIVTLLVAVFNWISHCRNKELEEQVSSVDRIVDTCKTELMSKDKEIQFCKFENIELRQQLSVINQVLHFLYANEKGYSN